MELPRISVLVPCYNYAHWVAEAVDSILAQTDVEFELIVINDGSTDDSLQVIRRLQAACMASAEPIPFHVIDQPNAGVSVALNAGLKVATGEFVATFDADDIMPPGRLRLMASHLHTHPEVVCVGGKLAGFECGQCPVPEPRRSGHIKRLDFDQVLREGMVVGGGAVMFRRTFFLRVGGFDERLRVQDMAMTLRLSAGGGFIDVLPDVVTWYRKHAGSLSQQAKHEFSQGMLALADYQHHRLYPRAIARLKIRVMKTAIHTDAYFASQLAHSVPWRYRGRLYWRRVRHLLRKLRQEREVLLDS